MMGQKAKGRSEGGGGARLLPFRYGSRAVGVRRGCGGVPRACRVLWLGVVLGERLRMLDAGRGRGVAEGSRPLVESLNGASSRSTTRGGGERLGNLRGRNGCGLCYFWGHVRCSSPAPVALPSPVNGTGKRDGNPEHDARVAHVARERRAAGLPPRPGGRDPPRPPTDHNATSASPRGRLRRDAAEHGVVDVSGESPRTEPSIASVTHGARPIKGEQVKHHMGT